METDIDMADKFRQAEQDRQAGNSFLVADGWQQYPHQEPGRYHFMKVLPVGKEGVMGHVEPSISGFGGLTWNAWIGPLTQRKPPLLEVQDRLRVRFAPCLGYEHLTDHLLKYAQALQDIADKEQEERRNVRDSLLEYIHCKVWQTAEPVLPDTIGPYETVGIDTRRI